MKNCLTCKYRASILDEHCIGCEEPTFSKHVLGVFDDSTKKVIVDTLNDIVNEIIRIGWDGVINKYVINADLNDPESLDLCRLYKRMHDFIKERTNIPYDGWEDSEEK